MLSLVKGKVQEKIQFDTSLIEALRVGKIIEHKYRLIHVKVRSDDHKYGILSKTPNLKGLKNFIKEYLIPEDQVEIIKEVEKVKEDKIEGK